MTIPASALAFNPGTNMKKMSKLTALALAFAGASALAGPTSLGTGPGTYSFDGTKDAAFFVDLAAGTYQFTVDVEPNAPLDLNDAFLSYGTDKNPNGKNVIGSFAANGAGGFVGTVNATTTGAGNTVFLDIGTMLGKESGGTFNGLVTVTPVPEPASGALLLAGLGLFGFISRRRHRG
jgi:hypothetical protein